MQKDLTIQDTRSTISVPPHVLLNLNLFEGEWLRETKEKLSHSDSLNLLLEAFALLTPAQRAALVAARKEAAV